jgi:hypothetical protein
MVHAALLLLMLEAVTTDLVSTISLKRSTPKSSAIHRLAGRLSHLRLVGAAAMVAMVRRRASAASWAVVDNRSPNSAARTWEEAIRDLLKFIA